MESINCILGNPGAGKSTLLNCLVNQPIFKSGLSSGGLTQVMQQHSYQRQLWTDTPGLADPKRRVEAAAQIEAGLKQGQKYKLAFVITTDSGRVRVQDIETINCVCAAIKMEFTYGLIVNKLTPKGKMFLEEKDNMQLMYSLMKKQPSALLLVPKIEAAEDNDNVLITDPNRTKAAAFVLRWTPN